jgi:hypothetical protein
MCMYCVLAMYYSEMGNGVGDSQQSASIDNNTTLSSDTTKTTTAPMVSVIILTVLD